MFPTLRDQFDSDCPLHTFQLDLLTIPSLLFFGALALTLRPGQLIFPSMTLLMARSIFHDALGANQPRTAGMVNAMLKIVPPSSIHAWPIL